MKLNIIQFYRMIILEKKKPKKWSGMYMFESVLALGKYGGKLNLPLMEAKCSGRCWQRTGLNARISHLQPSPLSV